jgi:hypothetical protein
MSYALPVVSFTAADHARIVAGQIRVTWRLWKYAHVKAGKVYPAMFDGALAIEDVRAVRAAEVTDADAAEVGLRRARDLIELAREHTGASITDDTLLYRVQFRYLPERPAKPSLSIAEVAARLDRLDRASPVGPWTLQALRLIEENPGVVARALALEAGFPTSAFKINVRKLKGLGLTLSLQVGYELTELGQSYLDSLEE